MKESREIIPTSAPERREIERPFDAPRPINDNGNYGMYRGAEPEEGLQIWDYWRAIRKRLWLVIGVAVLITTLTAIYMSRKPNIYESKATVQVDLEQANPDLVSKERSPLMTNNDPAYFNTQLQILNSDTLLRRVVKDLDLENNKEFARAKAEDSISPWQAILRTVGLATKDKKEGSVGDVPMTASSSVASSEDVAEAVRLSPFVEIIKKDLTVDPVREGRSAFKETRLIELKYKHTDSQFAALIVNSVADIFTKSNQEKRTKTSGKTNNYLDEQILNLQNEVAKDQKHFQELSDKAGIIPLEGDKTIDSQALDKLNQQLLEAENERKKAEAQYSAALRTGALEALAEDSAARRTNEEYQVRLATLNQQREQLLIEFTEAAPEIKEIDKQIASLNKALVANKQNAKNTLIQNLRTHALNTKAQEDKLRTTFDEQRNIALKQGSAKTEISLLKSSIETKKNLLEDLTKQQRSNEVVSAGTDNNVSIADIAIPNDVPVSPRRLSAVLAALFLSTLFGMGLALFLEFLDDTIRSTEEVENLLRLPALAAIPAIDLSAKRRLLLVGSSDDEKPKGRSELLISNDSRSSLAEAYRQLRTSVLLSTAGHAPKSLLITSSVPAEGKTTTAVNTAISLAQTGANVLIIDADMRRPRLHSIFDISNAQGLSTILSSNLVEDEILELIQIDDETNLHLLPSGPIPPNPAELIGSEQMRNLLKGLENNFTHIVIDSPPIASFTDGVLISSMVDGVILVVHSGKSSRQIVKRSRQLLQDVGAKVFGVVLNNVNLRSQDNYYYYQSYYHRSQYNQDDNDE